MVTAVSSSARHPLTVTLESASSSSWPVNKQGVASSWMLLVGLNKIFVLDPSEYCSSRESSVTHWSFNWLSSLGEDPLNNFLESRMLISFIYLFTWSALLGLESRQFSQLRPLHDIKVNCWNCTIPFWIGAKFKVIVKLYISLLRGSNLKFIERFRFGTKSCRS